MEERTVRQTLHHRSRSLLPFLRLPLSPGLLGSVARALLSLFGDIRNAAESVLIFTLNGRVHGCFFVVHFFVLVQHIVHDDSARKRLAGLIEGLKHALVNDPHYEFGVVCSF